MKHFTTVLAAAAIAVCAALPAKAASVCLQTFQIDHTSVLDTKTIIFHMKGGKAWKNTLLNPCAGLNFHGFIMNVHGGTDEVCSNQQSIKVLESGNICMMGEFTPYAVPEKSKS